MAYSSSTSPLGPFSERFEKVEPIFRDPGFSQFQAWDCKSHSQIQVQSIQKAGLSEETGIAPQWEAIRACQGALWFRPREWLVKEHWGILLSWAPPGRFLQEVAKIQPDWFYLKWLAQGLRDLASLHSHGLLHLAQNEKSWILFKPEENEGEEILGLRDLGLLVEIPLGADVRLEAAVAIAPEVLRGHPVDTRADLYALAALLLRQRSAHRFRHFDSLEKNVELHLQGRFVDLVPKTASFLNDLLRKMLEPDPKDRPETAAEILKMLDPKGDPEEELPQPWPEWAGQRIRGRQVTLLLNIFRTLVHSNETPWVDDLFKETEPFLAQDHEAYLRYLQACRAEHQGRKDEAREFRRQATVKCYSERDPQLKALLLWEEINIAEQESKISEMLKGLNQAWGIIQDYPDPILKARIRYRKGALIKNRGEDAGAFEEFYQAYALLPPEESSSLRGDIAGDLAELLAQYGMSERAVPFMAEALALTKSEGRRRARRHLQAARCYVGLGEWSEAQLHLSEAKRIFGGLKNLKDFLWAECQEVRLFLSQRDFTQARRALKALRNRIHQIQMSPAEGAQVHGPDLHPELLDLLELQIWLETGAGLQQSLDPLFARLQDQAHRALEQGFFCDLGWSPLTTSLLYERIFQKWGKTEEAVNFSKRAAEFREQIEAKLREHEIDLENLPIPEIPMESLSVMKVESLLTPEVAEKPESTSVQERIQDLELQLKEAESLQQRLLQENELLLKGLPRPAPPRKKASVPMAEASSKTPEGEKDLIVAALKKHQGNRGAVAKELKIHRRTLFEKMRRYGLEDLDFLPSREEMAAVLAKHEGNKSLAAQELGMSRSSFYRRMKELGL